MKYLGIDYGTKRIGIAVSDDTGKIAFPLRTVEAGREALATVADIAKEQKAEKIIIGESRNFKNEPNEVMEDIEQFKKDIGELTLLPVLYEVEFFTTTQAERGPDKFQRPTARFGTPTKASGENLDASAAALILQGYLDKLK